MTHADFCYEFMRATHIWNFLKFIGAAESGERIVMINNSKNISQTVLELALPIAKELNLNIWDVQYVKEGADMYLRITIDSDDGITIEDCERFHNAIDPVLDEADPIEDAYHLEVSSPGVERELKTDEHILKFIGSTVCAKTYAPINSQKTFIGTLMGLEDNKILLRCNEKDIAINRSSIAKLNIHFDFKKQ